MNNLSNRTPEFFGNDPEDTNLLWQYVQSMSSQEISQLSQPSSNEVHQLMERTISGMLGHLPSGTFGVNITTSREQLAHLLVSAMVNGYFLRNVEQRMTFEQSLAEVSTDI